MTIPVSNATLLIIIGLFGMKTNAKLKSPGMIPMRVKVVGFTVNVGS